MNPTGASGRQNQFFGQKASIPGINVNNAADNQLIFKNDFSTTLYYSTQGVPTVLLGLRKANASNGLSANQQGLFVSQPGTDVQQATDAQLFFNTSQNIFKVVKTLGGGTIINNVGVIGVTLAHNLGFAPSFLCYSTSTAPGDAGRNYFATGAAPLAATAYGVAYAVDSTNIYVSFASSSAVNYVASVKIYLFQESSGL